MVAISKILDDESYQLLHLVVATIGFSPANYAVSEDAGSVDFVFAVLDGNIAFDVSVLFFTTEGSATSMSIS